MEKRELLLSGNRLIAIDFFRGLAIIGVVLTHCLIYGVFYSVGNALATVPPYLLALLFPVVLIAPMAGLFAFISVTANTFTALRRFSEGHSQKHVLQPLLLTSAALIGVHFIFSLLFKNSSASMFDPKLSLDTIIPASIRQGEPVLPRFENLLFMDAMAMIAMSGLAAAAVLALILKRKPQRDKTLRCLAYTGFLSILLSPFIWYLFWVPFKYFYFSAFPLRLLSVPLSFFAARMHCLPGIFPFVVFGIWFGILLQSRPSYEELKKKTRPIAAASLILFLIFSGLKLFLTIGNETAFVLWLSRSGILSVFSENTPGIVTGNIGNAFLDYKALPVEFQFFGIALSFLGFPFLLKIFDYRSDETKPLSVSRLKPVLRFGTLSLTVFVCETPVHTVFAKIIHTLSGAPVPDMADIQPDFFMTHPPVWIAYAVFMILLWAVILKFWEKSGYRFSLEWILTKAMSPFRKIRSEKLPQERSR